MCVRVRAWVHMHSYTWECIQFAWVLKSVACVFKIFLRQGLLRSSWWPTINAPASVFWAFQVCSNRVFESKNWEESSCVSCCVLSLRTEAWLADTASCGKAEAFVSDCSSVCWACRLAVSALVHTRAAEGIQQMGDWLLLLTFKTSTDAHFSLLLCMSNHWNDPEQWVNCNKASTFGIQKNKNSGGRSNSGGERLLANVPVMKCQGCLIDLYPTV